MTDEESNLETRILIVDGIEFDRIMAENRDPNRKNKVKEIAMKFRKNLTREDL